MEFQLEIGKLAEYIEEYKASKLKDNIEVDIKDLGIEINTPKGDYPINYFIKKEKLLSLTITYRTKNGLKELVCAEKHILRKANKDIYAKDLIIGDALDHIEGTVLIEHIKHNGLIDCFDINVPSPHLYYDANGLVHHNTIITAALSNLVESYGRSVVIVPNKGLVTQTEEDYINLGLDVGVYFGERKELGHTHTICTWQSLEHLIKAGKGLPKDEQPITQITDGVICVMCDECHGAQAAVLRSMLCGPFANIPLRFGLTGTIPKEEHLFTSILGSIGPVLGEVNAKELQDKGVLSNCHVNVLQTLDTREFSSFHSEHDYLTADKDRLKWFADFISKVGQTGNTLVLVDRIKSGKVLQELLNENLSDDEKIPFISGEVKLVDRKKEYDEVKESYEKIIIASYGVAAVGINIPRIFNLVLFEPGKSFVRVIQSIGRGIRRAEDKDFVQIWDICASTKYSKRHLTKRKTFYKEAQYPFTVKKIHINEDASDLFGETK